MRAARVLAQAKVNLFLRILGREAAGYHALETLFQRLDLGDEVTVRVDVRGRALDCRGADVGPVERNLAWRAALAYADAAAWPDGFAVELEKRIPAGGGLGGGSADAGAVLRVLEALAPRPLGAARLLDLALRLGADVPFLTTEAARALAWGRGERMLALPPLPAREICLLLPDVPVSTGDAFRWLAEGRPAGWTPAPRLLAAEQLATWEGVAELAENDFEPVVRAHVPALAPWLPAEGAAAAAIHRLSGSGSTVFWLGVERGAAPPAAWPPAGATERVRMVRTRTAERVVPVERIE